MCRQQLRCGGAPRHAAAATCVRASADVPGCTDASAATVCDGDGARRQAMEGQRGDVGVGLDAALGQQQRCTGGGKLWMSEKVVPAGIVGCIAVVG